MKIVYIAHPISGDVEGNLAKIREIVRYINVELPDVVPFVPYYADVVSMDDNNPPERARGIKNDTEFFSRRIMDEVWVCGPISKGVEQEVRMAWKYGIPVFDAFITANLKEKIKPWIKHRDMLPE